MKIIKTINFHNVLEDEAARYAIRDTVRGLIYDSDGRIALLHVSKHGFYKLPGGGIENGENIIEAFRRECMEEAGVNINEPKELGIIREIKKEVGVVQNSYCFVSTVIGNKQGAQFTDSEKDNVFELLWVSPQKAMDLVKSAGYSNSLGRYVAEREILILEFINL